MCSYAHNVGGGCAPTLSGAAAAGAVGVDRHVVWFEGRRGTFHNACLGGSKLLVRGGLKRVCGSYSWGSWVALCSSRSTPIWAVSSARGCVADWDWRLMGQCCVFRQLHTDLATILVLESRATAPLPPKAVEDGGSRARQPGAFSVR